MTRFLPYILIFLFIEILFFSFYFRMESISFLIIPDEETRNQIMMQIIAHDAIIYAYILMFIYLSYLNLMPKFISYILRIMSIITIFIYFIDIYTIKHFVTHININDVKKYFVYAPKYIGQQYDINIFHILILLTVIILIFIFIKKNLKLLVKYHILFTVSIITLFMINSFSKDTYVHAWVYKNFIEYNIDIQKQSKNYSDEFVRNISIDEKIICEDNLAQKRNIIILMVESLASYQSNYFSGIRNWTPSLDKIAKSNTAIKEFNSNGFITEDAEISILTGLLPIYSPKLKTKIGSTAFQGFFGIKDSLVNHLNNKKYITEFITSSDLTFSNTGLWAKSIGFKYIEGSDHPYYKDKKRYHFEAPADEFLFKRVQNRISIKKEDIPYFIFIKTVSSHIPFINPENGNYSEEETIRYVDKQIGLFYQYLEKRDFFRDGLLIIVGDHHPIIPLKQEQLLKYGINKAGTKVPFVISLGGSNNEEINGSYHQIDIYNSLKNFTSDKKCTSLWKGDFLSYSSEKAPKYTVYRRGDQRGVVSVFSENKTYNVQLNGDNTKVKNEPDSELIRTIVNKINYERIKRQENTVNY